MVFFFSCVMIKSEGGRNNYLYFQILQPGIVVTPFEESHMKEISLKMTQTLEMMVSSNNSSDELFGGRHNIGCPLTVAV